MRRVLLDHNVPSPIAQFLSAYDVMLAEAIGWARLKNGELLNVAEDAGFDVLVSGDRKLRYEQNMAGRKIGIVAMSANHWNLVEAHVPAILRAIEEVKPGELLPVYCGTFVPRRFRKPKQ